MRRPEFKLHSNCFTVVLTLHFYWRTQLGAKVKLDAPLAISVEWPPFECMKICRNISNWRPLMRLFSVVKERIPSHFLFVQIHFDQRVCGKLTRRKLSKMDFALHLAVGDISSGKLLWMQILWTSWHNEGDWDWNHTVASGVLMPWKSYACCILLEKPFKCRLVEWGDADFDKFSPIHGDINLFIRLSMLWYLRLFWPDVCVSMIQGRKGGLVRDGITQ